VTGAGARLLAISLVLALGVGGLAGCGKKDDNQPPSGQGFGYGKTYPKQ
jgi:hypothetical protein